MRLDTVFIEQNMVTRSSVIMTHFFLCFIDTREATTGPGELKYEKYSRPEGIRKLEKISTR